MNLKNKTFLGLLAGSLAFSCSTETEFNSARVGGEKKDSTADASASGSKGDGKEDAAGKNGKPDGNGGDANGDSKSFSGEGNVGPGKKGKKETSGDSEKNSEKKPEKMGDIDSKEEVINLCSDGSKKMVTNTLVFERRQDCSWEMNGNLETRNNYLQARETQTRSVPVKNGDLVCNVSVSSATETFHYDDTLFFTLNDYILMSSNDNVVPDFETDGNLLLWKWQSIAGKNRSFNKANSYCFGADDSCSVPGHDQEGKLEFSLDDERFSELAVKLAKKNQLDFSVTATGDNDAGDCYHSHLELDVQMEVVKATNTAMN